MASKARGRGGVRVASSGASPGGIRPHRDPSTAGGWRRRGRDRRRARAGRPGRGSLVSVALLYHLAAVVAGAMGVPPSSELERAIADGFTPYFDAMDLGYSYRFYAEPGPTPVVTATIQYEDGRPEETVRLPGRDVAGPRMRHQRQLALANALYDDVQEDPAAGRGRRPEPAGAGLRAPPLPDPSGLPERDAAPAAAPDPRRGPGAAGARVPRMRRGSICSTIGCSPRPNGSETSRATTSERGPELSGRARGGHPAGMGRLLLHPGRPDGPGADPRGDRPAGVLEPAGPRAGPARLFRLRRLGRAVGDPGGASGRWPGRSGSWCPTAACGWPGWPAWSCWPSTRSGCSAGGRPCWPG